MSQSDLFGRADEVAASAPPLHARFLAPPFTILDARQGYWRDRKAQWIDLGLRGEEGRGHAIDGDGAKSGKVFNINDWHGADGWEDRPDTSVFDPVLCEIAYRWFLPDGGAILDPFAGEATKGIVAALLGYAYTGIEVRPEQVEANVAQARRMGVDPCPAWVCGDSAHMDGVVPRSDQFDLVFTSPPYYDLEVYSSRADDGSTLGTYPEFMAWYSHIFAQAFARLRENRFAVVKVGDIRDRETGVYRNFPGDTITAFRRLGLHLYNELILIMSAGTLPLRVARAFRQTRKVGKAHQNVLVFYKGDPRAVRDHFPQDIGGLIDAALP